MQNYKEILWHSDQQHWRLLGPQNTVIRSSWHNLLQLRYAVYYECGTAVQAGRASSFAAAGNSRFRLRWLLIEIDATRPRLWCGRWVRLGQFPRCKTHSGYFSGKNAYKNHKTLLSTSEENTGKGLTSHWTQNGSFWRRYYQPIAGIGTKLVENNER